MLYNCYACQKSFDLKLSRLKKAINIHCSKKCSGVTRSKIFCRKIKTSCKICNKEIYFKQSKFKNTKNPTCSYVCSAEFRKRYYSRGKNNPRSLKLNDFERYFWEKSYDCNRRAQIKKLEATLTYKQLIGIFNSQNGKCFYSGIPMVLKSNPGKTDYNVLSIDRKDSTKGYTVDNILMCLNCLNMMKSNHDINIIKEVCEAVYLKNKGISDAI